jgi:UDP-2,3-diacylglucosamine hydrolase
MPSFEKTLFISDLHLDAENSVITQCFLNFLQSRATGCKSLYILGDLFEAWVGDDDNSPLSRTVANALQQLSQSGSAVYIMHGNRDFLIGKEFADKCGASLLEEPAIISCHGQKLALLHGDTLCTRDVEYLQFRKMVRSERWQNDFLAKSLVERHMIAQQARQQSKEQSSHKASDIMDVTHQEVLNLFYKSQVNYIIHGHTHRPAVHTLRLQEPINGLLEAHRIVLGSWDSNGWVLEFSDDGFDLKHFPH